MIFIPLMYKRMFGKQLLLKMTTQQSDMPLVFLISTKRFICLGELMKNTPYLMIAISTLFVLTIGLNKHSNTIKKEDTVILQL